MADEELKDDLTEDQVEAEEQEETPEAPDPEAEAEARKYGWRDKSEKANAGRCRKRPSRAAATVPE